jgi:acetyl-CoA decarbonylase/synthase complex subunit gamma
MAFAMALAAGKASLEACPHASDEAKEALGAASEPPIRSVVIGTGENALTTGGELVLFRHDKTFYNPTGLAVEVRDDLDEAALKARVEAINNLSFTRVGITQRVNLVAVIHTSSDATGFSRVVAAVKSHTALPLVLKTADPAVAEAACAACGQDRPLIWGASESNAEAMTELAKKHGCPLVVSAPDLAKLAALSERITGAGYKDLVLHLDCENTADTLQALTIIRRMALKKQFRPFGFPVLVKAAGQNPYQVAAAAGTYIAKYGSIVVLDVADPVLFRPLVTLRQDIYTDPQKPIQVEATCYAIGNVREDSPVLVTTNFSLTYFSVVNEIEASRVPAYLVTVNTDGTSVLTAWAAGKFGSEQIAEALEQNRVGEKVNHRKVIIPGYVAMISGRLAEKSGWEVLVGPREAAGLPKYLRSLAR